MNKLIAITKNTFIEILRQPVYAIIISASILLFILAPSVSMYTMDDDNKMLRELGLSTLFLTGLLVAIFSASAAVDRGDAGKKADLYPVEVFGGFAGRSCSPLSLNNRPFDVDTPWRDGNGLGYTRLDGDNRRGSGYWDNFFANYLF